MIKMASMDSMETRLVSCKNEIVNLCTVLEQSKEEDEWMQLLHQLELKLSSTGLEILLALKSLILSCTSKDALKNLMLLFLRKVSALINELGIQENEQLAQEALIIFNTFWSVCANRHAALLRKVACRFSAEFYEILPSLASIYVDLFLIANSTKLKVQKLSRKLYGWLNFELNERCMKTALLEVYGCSTAGAKILSPILIKLLSEPPPRNSDCHLDYLLHFLVLKRWLPVCDDLKDIAESSSQIKAPVKFLQWLIGHWPQGSDYIPTDKSLKGRRVSQLLLELDGKAIDELIDVFAQCLVSGEEKTTKENIETSTPVFVIDKKGSGVNEERSAYKRPKKRRKIEQEMDESVADSSHMVVLPAKKKKSKSIRKMQSVVNGGNETIEIVGEGEEQEAMEVDEALGEADINRFHKQKIGQKEKKCNDSPSSGDNLDLVVSGEKNSAKTNNTSAEPLGFFIDRNSNSLKKQPAALTQNTELHYFQASPDISGQLGETENTGKNSDMEIKIIETGRITEEKEKGYGSDQSLTLIKSKVNSPNLRNEQILSSPQKTGRGSLFLSSPSPQRDRHKTDSPLTSARCEYLASKPLAAEVDLKSDKVNTSDKTAPSESDIMQPSQTVLKSKSPRKYLASDTEIIPASNSDESENCSPMRSVKRRKGDTSDERSRASSMSPEIEIIGKTDASQDNDHIAMEQSLTDVNERESLISSSVDHGVVVEFNGDSLASESDVSVSISGNVDGLVNENLTCKSNVVLPLVDTDAVEVREDADDVQVIEENVAPIGTSEHDIGLVLAEIRRSMNSQKSPLGKSPNSVPKLRSNSKGRANPSPNRRSKCANNEKTAVKSKKPLKGKSNTLQSNALTDWLRTAPSSVVLHNLEDVRPEVSNVQSEGLPAHSRQTPVKSPRLSQARSPGDTSSNELKTTDPPVTTPPKKEMESESRVLRRHKIRSQSQSRHSDVEEAQGEKPLPSPKKKRTSLPLTLESTQISNTINSDEKVNSTGSSTKKRTPSPEKTHFTKLTQKLTDSETQPLIKSPLKSPLTSITSVSPQKHEKKQNSETAKELTPNDVFGKSLKTYSKKDLASTRKRNLEKGTNDFKEGIESSLSKLPTGLSDTTSSDSSPRKDQTSPLKRKYFLRGTTPKRSDCQACGLKEGCTQHQQSGSATDSSPRPGSPKPNKKEAKASTPPKKSPKISPMNHRKSLRSSSNKL